MRKLAEVETLRSRRIGICDKFARKCIAGKFGHWFPEKARVRARSRAGDTYLEEYARCDRLKNTPIFYMRRRMNGKPGRTYGERNSKYRE